MKTDYDLAIVGSGFGGALLAMIARRMGRSVILLERGQHPRFAIGESSTPLANLLLEKLARRYDLPNLLPLTKWGTWQATYPEIACGLKRGFTFYHHQHGQPWRRHPERENELMVAASPRDAVADTHWYRPDFDHLLVRQAQALGVNYLDQTAIAEVKFDGDGLTLHANRDREPINIRARFLVDASGPRGFLHRALDLKEMTFPHLPATQSLFTHFTSVAHWGDLHPSHESPPYPPDDAALHHVFDGGWIWVLRFNNGITSAGIAATPKLAEELKLSEGEPAWHRLLERLPGIKEQFRDAQAVLPFVYAPRLPFHSERIAGERWAMLPSAAGFVDPLLSSGFPLTLLGIRRLAQIFEGDLDSSQLLSKLSHYEQQTRKELLATESVVSALYRNMGDLPRFAALSRLYFAAASFTETVRRLDRPDLAGESFLAWDQPHFGPGARVCLEGDLAGNLRNNESLADSVHAAIEPIDVAGLNATGLRNWYPSITRESAVAAVRKLGLDPALVCKLTATL